MLLVVLQCDNGARAALPISGDFTERWVGPTDPLTLRIDPALHGRSADLRIFAGPTDISALVRSSQPGQLRIDPRGAPLPGGEGELVVWLVDGSEWRELARLPLKVLSRGGFEAAAFTPKLDLAGKSQFDERTRGAATPAPRPRFADLTGRGGAAFTARRGALALDGNFNGSGSSYRNEALRFGERQTQAAKVDLGDYAVNARYRDTGLSVGHQTTGTNPLLLNGFASRGIGLGQKFGPRLDLRLNALNGSSIVGYDNLLGLDEAEHRVYTAIAGVELIAARPGALRAEVSYLDATVSARNNFNVGEIRDAERSHGLGLRIAGATAGGRVRGDVVLARSTYTNPFDPLLAQGGDLQPVQPATASGRIADFSVDLLQGWAGLSSEHPLTTTLALHHARVAPLYRSLGAFFAADQALDRVTLNQQAGGTQVQLLAARQEDNVDDVPTILKSRTTTLSATLALPLAQLLGTGGATSGWPQLNYVLQSVAQQALNTPVAEDSGFAASQRPDQRNRSHQLSLAWNIDTWTVSYGLSRSTQDNRQPGRELADFDNTGHQGSLSWRASDRLSLSAGLNVARNHSRERDLTTTTDFGNLGIDWRVTDRWAVAANVGRTLGGDSRDFTASANGNAQAQLTYSYEVASFGRKLPGQVFVRFVRATTDNRDSTFGLSARGVQWAWDAGLSLSLF